MDQENIINLLELVLDRKRQIDSLSELRQAFSSSVRENESLRGIAVGIDTCVFLKLGKHARSSDILDYLTARHEAPLIIPGQAIQEFWNNHLHSIDTQAINLKRKYEELKKLTGLINADFSDYHARFEGLIAEFDTEYGYIYDEGSKRRASRVLESLKDAARIPYAPRSNFSAIAANRKRTKTPPGFKDELDGDFYIWLDFLYGLMTARSEGGVFTKAVLITDDVKPDWSRSGTAHPILTAEVRELLGVSFETWSLEKLALEITKELENVSHAEVPPEQS